MQPTITTDGKSSASPIPSITGSATTQVRHKLWRRPVFWTSLAVVPTAIGAGVTALTRSRRTGVIAGAVSALGLAAMRWQLQRLFTDEPDYIVERRIGNLELRRYPARVEARIKLDDADFDAALDRGFRRLAGYLFGGNRTGERLEMTTPVAQSPEARGEKLEMTTPVITGPHPGGHVMSFVMPPSRSLGSLPRPLDAAVELVAAPARRVAVLGYRGRYRGAGVAERAAELRRLASRAGLATIGEPMFAGFDPPSTLPWLRRNEMWIELA